MNPDNLSLDRFQEEEETRYPANIISGISPDIRPYIRYFARYLAKHKSRTLDICATLTFFM